MQLTHALIMAGVLTAGAGTAVIQDPPPATQSTPPPSTQTPEPVVTSTPSGLPPLNRDQMRQRRSAIFLMEGVLANAVKLAAQTTASEIRRIEPGIVMFSAAPVRAHGTHLEGYGVFFQVEIPSVIPSVASLLETLGRDRSGRPGAPPAQAIPLSGSAPEAAINPDAHYVQSVKFQLVDAMVRMSNSIDLRPDEWLTVSARDGSEVPGQLSEPSTMILRIKGSDLAAFFAGRITIDEARRRVEVSGF